MEQKKMGARGFLSGFSRFTRGLIGAFLGLFGAIALWRGLLPEEIFPYDYWALLLLLLGLAALAALALWWGRLYLLWEGSPLARWRPSPWLGLAALLAAGLALRLTVVLRYQVAPEVDYYTIYHAGELLSQQYDISGVPEFIIRYVALFPHIFGYASFLGLLFSVFGASPLVAAVANAVISTIALALVYYIGYKLQGHVLGFLAGLLWCFYPSQILYNMLVTSDPYYTTLLLGSIALLFFLHGKLSVLPWWAAALGGGAMGLLLSLANSARPVAPIVIIAAAVVLFVIQPLSREKAVGKKAVLLAGLLVVYLAGNQLNSWVFTQRIGEAPASVPGFNLLVGFNMETNGSYSSKDSELLTAWNDKEGISAKEVQEAMLDAALDRITSGEVDFLPLFYKKLCTLWSGDDSAVGYGEDVFPHPSLYSGFCNGYHYFLWLLALGPWPPCCGKRARASSTCSPCIWWDSPWPTSSPRLPSGTTTPGISAWRYWRPTGSTGWGLGPSGRPGRPGREAKHPYERLDPAGDRHRLLQKPGGGRAGGLPLPRRQLDGNAPLGEQKRLRLCVPAPGPGVGQRKVRPGVDRLLAEHLPGGAARLSHEQGPLEHHRLGRHRAGGGHKNHDRRELPAHPAAEMQIGDYPPRFCASLLKAPDLT